MIAIICFILFVGLVFWIRSLRDTQTVKIVWNPDIEECPEGEIVLFSIGGIVEYGRIIDSDDPIPTMVLTANSEHRSINDVRAWAELPKPYRK